MGRTGISEYAVRQAINEIIAAGNEPSIKKVQALIGGSNTTIGAHLKRIADQDGGMFGERGIVDRELSQAVISLHDRLKSMTEQQIAQGEITAQKLVEAARKDVEQEKFAHAETSRLLGVANTELEQSRVLAGSTIEKLNAANSELAGMAKEITALQESKVVQGKEIDRLQREGATRQVAFEGYQESTARAREALAEATARDRTALMDSHESALNHLRHEKDKLTSERSDLTIQMGLSVRDNERLSQEVIASSKALRAAQDTNRDLLAKLDIAREEISETRIAAAEAKGQVTLLAQQLTESNASRDNAMQTLQNTLRENVGLITEVARLQSELKGVASTPASANKGT